MAGLIKLNLRVHENIDIVGDPTEIHRRPTCLIVEPLGTGMPDWRPPCLLGDWHTQSETHWKPTCVFKFRLDYAGMSVSDGSPQAYRSLLDLQPIMSVSNQACWSPIKHVGLWWFSDEAWRGPQRGMSVSNWSLIKHVEVSHQTFRSLIDLHSGMSVYDNKGMFVNSKFTNE